MMESPRGPVGSEEPEASAPGQTEHHGQPAAGDLPDPGGIKDKTIGQVLSHLDGDFPGLSASKVRFLEDRGLLFPQRTSTGYRKYSAEDIDRLRYILSLQRDHYLPLKVIKEKVDALDQAGEGFPALSPGNVPEETAPLPEQAGPRTWSMRELSKHTTAPLPLLRELIAFGLIAAGPEGTFDEHAARTASLCVRLTSHGLQPRHLRLFRAAADREMDLVQQSVAPLASRRDEESREKAARTARELAGLCTSLHAALVADLVEKNW